MSASRPRVVLDTNVCLDLFVFDDPRCAALFDALRDGSIEAVTRDDCRAEWLAVLDYPQLALDPSRRAQALAAFDRWVRWLPSSEIVTAIAVHLPRCADRDDQKFLELALASSAVVLITRDDALLRLGRRTHRDGLFAIVTPSAWRDGLAADVPYPPS